MLNVNRLVYNSVSADVEPFLRESRELNINLTFNKRREVKDYDTRLLQQQEICKGLRV